MRLNQCCKRLAYNLLISMLLYMPLVHVTGQSALAGIAPKDCVMWAFSCPHIIIPDALGIKGLHCEAPRKADWGHVHEDGPKAIVGELSV